MTMQSETLEALVSKAVAGDAHALDALVREVKDDIYGLAMRMLWHPADAEDATQEVLIRVVTGLASFEGRSKFRSWVYRVAVRGLLNWKRGRAEEHVMSFEDFGDDLERGLDASVADSLDGPERSLLRSEVRIACTQAMLLCLDREHRMAYLLGEILQMDGLEAAECLDVPAATYRKRLSRARQRVKYFTANRCGVVSESAACSCDARIGVATSSGRIDPKNLLFARHPVAALRRGEAEAVVEAIGSVCDGGSLMRSNPTYAAPDTVLSSLTTLTSSGAKRAN